MCMYFYLNKKQKKLFITSFRLKMLYNIIVVLFILQLSGSVKLKCIYHIGSMNVPCKVQSNAPVRWSYKKWYFPEGATRVKLTESPEWLVLWKAWMHSENAAVRFWYLLVHNLNLWPYSGPTGTVPISPQTIRIHPLGTVNIHVRKKY